MLCKGDEREAVSTIRAFGSSDGNGLIAPAISLQVTDDYLTVFPYVRDFARN